MWIDIFQKVMLDWLFGRSKQEQKKPKEGKKKNAQEQQAQDKWKYDLVIQFLSGPIWRTSILDFVDYHCIVFDSQEENKFEYTTIHNKFKEMVGTLFDGMMKEVGLDDDKLAQLLDQGLSSKHKKIFNQLLLADDFMKFKKLMVNRNRQLQTEAVKAYNNEKAPKASKSSKPSRTEEQILQQSIISEQERIRKLEQEEEEQIRKVLQMSKIEAQDQSLIKSLEEKVAQKEVSQPLKEADPPQHPTYLKQPEVPVSAPKPEPAEIPMPAPGRRNRRNMQPLEPLPPVKQPRKIEESHKQEPKIQQKVPEEKPAIVERPIFQSKPVFEPVPVIEAQPVVQEKKEVQGQQDRKKRLMQQRERIRRKKQEQRKKQMQEQEHKGAPVQTIVLQEDGIHETNIGVGEQEDKKVNNAEIERRRQLMKRIKNRIVDDF